jgi:hypothetical protein
MYLLCTDVGAVRPVDLSRTRQCPRLEARPAVVARLAEVAGGPPAGEAKRVLILVEWNLTALTRTVPMEDIEDLPSSMKPHVVGVPWTWVQLFHHLVNADVHYGRANRPRP